MFVRLYGVFRGDDLIGKFVADVFNDCVADWDAVKAKGLRVMMIHAFGPGEAY